MASNAYKSATLTAALLARKGTAAPAIKSAIEFDPTTDRVIQKAAEPVAPVRATNPGHQRRAATGSHGVVAMTLRLDPERHFRLRLLSAHIGQSSQRLLTEALDHYLDSHGADIDRHSCLCADKIR